LPRGIRQSSITNPLDVMVVGDAEKRLPATRVVAMAGVLDSARFLRYFLSEALGVSSRGIRLVPGRAQATTPCCRWSVTRPWPSFRCRTCEEGWISQREADANVPSYYPRDGGAEIVGAP